MAVTLNPSEKIWAIYNQDRINRGKLAVNPVEFELQSPELYTGPRSPTTNTRVKAIPKSAINSFGTFNFYYNRENLATAVVNPKIVKGSLTTIHGAIAEINEELGIASTIADWVDGNLGSTNFTLTATPENLIFVGSVTFTYYV